MLLPNKREVDEVAQLLVNGADGPTELAKAVIRKVSELREEREQWFVVYALSRGAWGSEGPFSTRAAAIKGAEKMPVLQVLDPRWTVVPAFGPKFNRSREQEARDKPPAAASDFAVVREDALAFSRGWKGDVKSRDQFLQPPK